MGCQRSVHLKGFWKVPGGERCHKIFEFENRFKFKHFEDNDDKTECGDKEPLEVHGFQIHTPISKEIKLWFNRKISICKRLKTGVYLKSFFLLIFNERAVMGIITILWILINTCRYTD